MSGKTDSSSQPAGFFRQDNLVSPVGQCDGRLHTGRTATDDKHFFRNEGRTDVLFGIFAPGYRIDGASCQAGGIFDIGDKGLTDTVVAPYAGSDIVGPAAAELAGHLGIGNNGAAHGDDIGFAFGQHLFHQLRFIQSAHNGHRCFNGLFNSGRKFHIDAKWVEHARNHMLIGFRVMERTGSHMNQIDFSIQ